MKKLTSFILIVVVLCGVLSGCTPPSQPQKTAAPESSAKASEPATQKSESTKLAENTAQNTSAEKPKVAFICKSYSDAFCVWVKDEMIKKAQEQYANEFELVAFDSENNSTKQIDQINNCAANGFDVIMFQQVDTQAPVAAVKDAVAKGIKVIVVTGKIDDDGESVFIDASPEQQGTVLAEYSLTKLPENAKVAILQGPVGNAHANGRQKGIETVLATKPNIKIVDQQVGEWKKEKGMTLTQNWLSSIPDLNAVFAHNDDMALGAYEAIKMAGKEGQIQIYGIDGLPAAVQAVKDEKMMATVFQNAISYADTALQYASKAVKGEKVESVMIDSELISPTNVDKYIELHKQLGTR